MKITGDKKLKRQLADIPDEVHSEVRKSILRTTTEAERVANTLAPDVTHETRGNIYSEISDRGMTGRVLAIPSDAPREDKDRAYAIEHGRKRGIRGTTEGYHFIHRTRQYIGKKHVQRVRAAIRRGLRRSVRG